MENINPISEGRNSTPISSELIERSWHLDSLTRLGDIYEIDLQLDSPLTLKRGLSLFDDAWVQYNPYKPQNNRMGLSITSLDGGISGKPDLYSLQEYAKREGVLYRESDFKIPTEVYRQIPQIHRLIDLFLPDIGRCHFLKFGAGGFFPPHRDGALMEVPDCFRLLVPVFNTGNNSAVFMHNNRIIPLHPCSVYFVNTLLVHSLFSFSDDVIYMVCNIPITADNVKKIKSKLLPK